MRTAEIVRLIAAAAALFLLTGCPQKSTSVSTPPTPGGGPGGDDDQPVTVIGGSLLITWAHNQNFRPVSADVWRYRYSEASAAVEKVTYTFDSPSAPAPAKISLRRIANQPLTISITYRRASGSIASELQFVTAANGGNLDMQKHASSPTGLATYKDLAKKLLRHPDLSGRIWQIVVADLGTTLPGAGCTIPTGNKVTCTVNSGSGGTLTDNGSILEISVCKVGGGSCP
jgi:hypothetical protein